MDKSMPQAKTGQWDLTWLYSSPDDPQLLQDQTRLVDLYHLLNRDYRGQLTEKLGEALIIQDEIQRLSNRLYLFLDLSHAANLQEDTITSRLHDLRQNLNATFGEHGIFFIDEVARMHNETFQKLIASNPTCAHFLPYLKQIRRLTPHLLNATVEAALAKRAAFGADSWPTYFDQVRAALRFHAGEQEMTLTELLHQLTISPDPTWRATLLAALDQGLSGAFLNFSAQTINMITGAKRLEDQERGYPHPMAARNRNNQVDDAMVEALHATVEKHVVLLGERYYRLKAGLLGLSTLAWSDRNAPLPLGEPEPDIPFSTALQQVTQAFETFSPTLATLIHQCHRTNRIDVAPRPNKQSGAFNYSVSLPEDQTVSFVLLNYQGSMRDVMTLAHEMGHAVHGMLAGESQGPLMASPPMAYAETASLFGESIVFESLLAQQRASGQRMALLNLIMGKIGETLDTVLRQIGFSWFEKQLHASQRHLSTPQINALWQESLIRFYGPDGALFHYQNTDKLWSYITQFHAPFYVYAYAFGALLTQSLLSTRTRLGQQFEPLYLDMLKSGGTRDVRSLLAPFGLDPAAQDFWEQGILHGLLPLMTEAETLANELGLFTKNQNSAPI